MGFIDLFPKDKNRETEVSRGFRFFGARGTSPWHKAGITLTQLKTGAWDINEQVEGVHFNFLPYSVADENLTSRKFKEEWCTLQMTDVVKSRKETVNGKEKRFIEKTPWETWIQSATIQVMEAMFANKIKEDTSLGSALFVLSCFRMTWELLLREFPPTIRRLATAPC